MDKIEQKKNKNKTKQTNWTVISIPHQNCVCSLHLILSFMIHKMIIQTVSGYDK